MPATPPQSAAPLWLSDAVVAADGSQRSAVWLRFWRQWGYVWLVGALAWFLIGVVIANLVQFRLAQTQAAATRQTHSELMKLTAQQQQLREAEQKLWRESLAVPVEIAQRLTRAPLVTPETRAVQQLLPAFRAELTAAQAELQSSLAVLARNVATPLAGDAANSPDQSFTSENHVDRTAIEQQLEKLRSWRQIHGAKFPADHPLNQAHALAIENLENTLALGVKTSTDKSPVTVVQNQFLQLASNSPGKSNSTAGRFEFGSVLAQLTSINAALEKLQSPVNALEESLASANALIGQSLESAEIKKLADIEQQAAAAQSRQIAAARQWRSIVERPQTAIWQFDARSAVWLAGGCLLLSAGICFFCHDAEAARDLPAKSDIPAMVDGPLLTTAGIAQSLGMPPQAVISCNWKFSPAVSPGIPSEPVLISKELAGDSRLKSRLRSVGEWTIVGVACATLIMCALDGAFRTQFLQSPLTAWVVGWQEVANYLFAG
ncbi:MAG: hypothetical protein SFX18_19355 [Pirellulales bacterium]|nr:hypothetical protein [Pirellulales bacterium]